MIIDKVKFLKENGPLPQYNRNVKVNKDGSISITEELKIKAKGKPKKAK